jgi:propanol-preferring alcohol dehydrogenase
MKAAVLESFGSPLKMREVEIPRIGPTDVLVHVRACGLCGTDIKIASGKISWIPVPIVPGHEIAGEISQIGDQVAKVKVGDRVAVHFYVTCGRCRYCLSGQDPLCANLTGLIGFNMNGGLAEFVKVPAANIFPLADSVAFPEGAILADAVATPYQALVRHTGLRKGEVLVVVRAGGLGLHAVQIGRALGALVVVVDAVEAHLQKARELGADVTLNPERDNVLEVVKDRSDGRGADVVIDLAGRSETLEGGMEWLAPSGTLLVVGYNVAQSFSVSSAQMVSKALKIIGCRAATKADLADVIRWVEEKKITPVVEDTLPLERVDEAYKRIRTGEVMGRIVIIP